MIYVDLTGRLGNNLFQIAAACSLAKRLGVSFKARITDEMTPDDDSLFNYLTPFRENILRKVELISEVPADCEEYHSPDFSFHPLPEKDNLLLFGTFQSEKYFDEQAVRELFRIDTETDAYIRAKYGSLLDKHPVSVHIRRGDYLYLEWKHTVCKAVYYRRAMQCFPENSCFLIASDDIAWCKRAFKGDKFFFLEDETAVVSLYLQSMCSHYILSNSTFSWWGAWLNPDPAKTVICPTPWFGYRNRKFNTKDLLPASWTVLPVYSPPLSMLLNDCRVHLLFFYSRFCFYRGRIQREGYAYIYDRIQKKISTKRL